MMYNLSVLIASSRWPHFMPPLDFTPCSLHKVHQISNTSSEPMGSAQEVAHLTVACFMQVLEQLLRLVPGIRRIFVVVRSRPGVSGECSSLKPCKPDGSLLCTWHPILHLLKRVVRA